MSIDPDVLAAEKKFEAAQKKVKKANQTLVNARERRDYALKELKEAQRKAWLRRQARSL